MNTAEVIHECECGWRGEGKHLYHCTCGLEVKGGVIFYNGIFDSYAIMINVVSAV
jgi:hypothetical protein